MKPTNLPLELEEKLSQQYDGESVDFSPEETVLLAQADSQAQAGSQAQADAQDFFQTISALFERHVELYPVPEPPPIDSFLTQLHADIHSDIKADRVAEATVPSEAIQSEAIQPEATQPEATQPEAIQPEAIQSDTIQPDGKPSGILQLFNGRPSIKWAGGIAAAAALMIFSWATIFSGNSNSQLVENVSQPDSEEIFCAVGHMDTDLEAGTMVNQDEETGWTVIWIDDAGSEGI